MAGSGLDEVRITGLGVIADACLEFDGGLTVVTGETGAGKTMVVTALGLLFGGRADPGRVRPGAERALVEGRVRPSAKHAVGREVIERANEAGAELDDDGALLLGRSVSAEGRSRAYLGGRGVPAGVLADIGEKLVTVHGQLDQTRLLKPSEQRGALDAYAGDELAKLLASHRQLYRDWQQLAADLADRRARAGELAARAAWLRTAIEEIEQLDPQPGEDDELKSEARRLEHADSLRAASTLAHECLASDPSAHAGTEPVDVGTLLDAAQRALGTAVGDDPQLRDLAGRADELMTLAAELAADLASYADGIESDPARLEWVQERRATLRTVARKYVDGPDALLGWVEKARDELTGADSSDAALAELEAERDRLEAEVADLAGRLSQLRSEAADTLAAAVTEELSGLAMPHARVRVTVETAEPTAGAPSIEIDDRRVAIGPDGVDEVELLLVAHPGAPALPLQRGASGGELSRVMLAVEVVLAGEGSTPTLVFDEVDAGVGGKAAVEVGRRLARLARSHQVIVVTHLPQVAAFADRHLVVQKDTDGSVTTSGVRRLDEVDRARELSRMLAGLEDSVLGVAHAAELLDIAKADKSRQPTGRKRRTKAKD